MTASDAKRLAIASVSVTSALAILARLTEGDVPDVPRAVIGGFLTAAVLTFAADFAPSLVGSFAVLIMLAAMIGNGPDVWAAITARLGGGLPANAGTNVGVNPGDVSV